MKSDLDAVHRVFRSEAREQLDVVEQGLLALETSPEDAEALQRSFRALHTLKGSASTVGLRAIAEFAHGLEDLLEQLREGRLRLGQMVSSLLLDSVDALRSEIEREPGRDAPAREDDALSRLAQRIAIVRGGHAQSSHELQAQTPARSRPATDPAARIEMAQIDALLALAERVGAAHAGFRTLLREIPGPHADKLRDAFREPSRLLLELHQGMQRLRRVPIAPVLEPFVRMARDLSVSLGKRLRVDVRGEDASVDAASVDTLRSALTHVIRNAIDHGIEPAELRAERGKSPWGSLTLRATVRSGDLVVECTDDGAGIDREQVRERALARGLLDPDAPDSAVDSLVFAEGLSTASAVTELSGRGVGLGAVRSEVEALGGSIRISSVRGAGTTVSVRIPTSGSRGVLLCTRAGERAILIPLDEVVEIIDAPQVSREPRSGTLSIEGRAVIWAHLASLLRGEPAPNEATQLVVLERRGQRCAVAVEEVGCVESVRSQPLLSPEFGISASCALQSGGSGYLLDTRAILRRLGQEKP